MRTAFDRYAAALVIIAGAAGQFLDCYSADSVAASFAHASFGLMLCAAIVFRFGLVLRVAVTSESASGISAVNGWLVRRTSRETYILLFLLVFVRQLLNLAASLWWGAPLTHEINPLYFVSGLCCLMMIRLVASGTAAIAAHYASPDRSPGPLVPALAAVTRVLAKAPDA